MIAIIQPHAPIQQTARVKTTSFTNSFHVDGRREIKSRTTAITIMMTAKTVTELGLLRVFFLK